MHNEAIVFIELGGSMVPAGKLRITEDGRFSKCEFAYGGRYLDRPDAVAIDPVQLPLETGIVTAPADFPLFNAIRDAAPDAWGRSLIDKYVLRRLGRPASEAEFLLASQSGTRIGGLRFGADPRGPGRVLPFALPDFCPSLGDLEDFQALVDHPEDRELPEHLLDYIAPGADLGGARPKGTVMIDGQPWLAKFGRNGDRINMAAAEAGSLDLCEMAGIDTVSRRVLSLGGHDTLLLERFDRSQDDDGNIHRRHMVSSLTLLGAHELDRAASGYADLNDAMRRYGAGDAGEEIYRRMVMNVLVGNTDDHYRNHAFLLNDRGRYEMSPLYDVTPSLQVSASRSMFLHLGRAGDGREARLENAVAGGAALGLQREHAVSIANELSSMVEANWEWVMKARGCSVQDVSMMRNSFSEAGRQVNPDDPTDRIEARP